MVSLKHTFESAVADSADTALVQPSHWNAEHDLICATSVILGRITAGTGDVEELTPTQAKELLAIAIADITGLQAAIGGYGTATIDFGAFPGSNEGSVTFANTNVGTTVFPYFASNDTTTDHTANDHKYAAMLVQLSAQPDPGVGGTIHARSEHKMQGTFDVRYGY